MSVTESAKLPIVKIAAGAVIIFSAVGVGVMTGLIPGVSSQDKPVQTVQTESTPAPAAQVQVKHAAPSEQPAPHRAAAKEHMRVAAAQPARPERAAAPVCADCGVVQSINAVEVKGEGSGLGAVAGGVAGLIIGNQVGQGKGRTLAKVAGAAGGAYAGHEIEKNMKKTVQYDVAVRMDDGTFRTVRQASNEGLSTGNRVKIVGDTVVREGT